MTTMLTSTKLTWLRARRDEKIAALTIADETYLALLARRVADSSINTGAGSHRTRLVQLRELREEIKILESEIDELNRRISNFGGIVNINVRRKW